MRESKFKAKNAAALTNECNTMDLVINGRRISDEREVKFA